MRTRRSLLEPLTFNFLNDSLKSFKFLFRNKLCKKANSITSGGPALTVKRVCKLKSKGADELRTLGWFQMITISFLGAHLFSFELRALNLDFDREIKRREVVSVRLADELQPSKRPLSGSQKQKPTREPDNKNTSSGTFSVRLIPISR